MKRDRLKSRGFSLIELIMVLAIIATLAVIALPVFGGYRARAANAMAHSDITNLRMHLELYYADNQKFPSW